MRDRKLSLIQLDRVSILDKLSKAIGIIEANKPLKSYIMNNDLQSAWYAELHYLYLFFNSKYKSIVEVLEQSNIYNLRTTSFAEMANVFKKKS